jgi:hypothetical protein
MEWLWDQHAFHIANLDEKIDRLVSVRKVCESLETVMRGGLSGANCR